MSAPPPFTSPLEGQPVYLQRRQCQVCCTIYEPRLIPGPVADDGRDQPKLTDFVGWGDLKTPLGGTIAVCEHCLRDKLRLSEIYLTFPAKDKENECS
jgi:hypothetical protein